MDGLLPPHVPAATGCAVAPARPMAGRRFRTYCTHCRSSDVARVEIDPDTELPLVSLDDLIGAGQGGGA